MQFLHFENERESQWFPISTTKKEREYYFEREVDCTLVWKEELQEASILQNQVHNTFHRHDGSQHQWLCGSFVLFHLFQQLDVPSNWSSLFKTTKGKKREISFCFPCFEEKNEILSCFFTCNVFNERFEFRIFISCVNRDSTILASINQSVGFDWKKRLSNKTISFKWKQNQINCREEEKWIGKEREITLMIDGHHERNLDSSFWFFQQHFESFLFVFNV